MTVIHEQLLKNIQPKQKSELWNSKPLNLYNIYQKQSRTQSTQKVSPANR